MFSADPTISWKIWMLEPPFYLPEMQKLERSLDSGQTMYVPALFDRLSRLWLSLDLQLIPKLDPQINRHIVPAFYRYLQTQEPPKQLEYATELRTEISKLVEAADPSGPFFLGSNISFVDIQIAPWILRMRRVLAPYRGWPEPEEGTRWAKWVDAVERHEAVKATTSGDELYLDSYERYAG